MVLGLTLLLAGLTVHLVTFVLLTHKTFDERFLLKVFLNEMVDFNRRKVVTNIMAYTTLKHQLI